MKKYLVLTSILALAACGGGSGGHHGGAVDIPGSVETPEKPFTPVKDTVAESNSAITNMVSNSEYQVTLYVANKLGNDAESVGLGNIARTATSRRAFVPSSTAGSGNLNYDKAKELMELAQWLGDETTTHDDITAMFNKSKADQNKIKSALKLLDDMYCYVGGSADETARRILEKRVAKDFEKPMADLQEKSEILTLDKADFRALITTGASDKMILRVNEDTGEVTGVKFIDDGSGSSEFTPAAFYDFMKREDKTNKFEVTDDGTKGKLEIILFSNELGLKYSDFGMLTYTGTIEGEDMSGFNIPFAGGYTEKQINAADLSSDITFKGIAKGTVEPANISDQTPLNLETSDATLVFNKEKGTETLTAKFDNWYDVTATKTNNNNINMQFSEVGKDIAPDFQFGKKEQIKTVFESAYYGDNNVASEATALIQYQQQAKNPGTQNIIDEGNINVFIGFGGTAK